MNIYIWYNLYKVEPCCWSTYSKHRDTETTLAILDKLDADGERPDEEEIAQLFGYEDDYARGTITKWQRLRCRLWVIFNEPYSSTLAKSIACISIIIICLSVLCFCLKTNDNLRVRDGKYFHSNLTRQRIEENGKKFLYVFYYMEHICNAWFIVEIIIRCIVGTQPIISLYYLLFLFIFYCHRKL